MIKQLKRRRRQQHARPCTKAAKRYMESWNSMEMDALLIEWMASSPLTAGRVYDCAKSERGRVLVTQVELTKLVQAVGK